MTKIYLIRNQMILEIELIKVTPEQLRIDNKEVHIVWKSEDAQRHAPYLPTRLTRHREIYFDRLEQAVDYLAAEARKTIERSVKNIQIHQDRLAALVVFADSLSEETKEQAHAE